jgi:hypothetical protein
MKKKIVFGEKILRPTLRQPRPLKCHSQTCLTCWCLQPALPASYFHSTLHWCFFYLPFQRIIYFSVNLETHVKHAIECACPINSLKKHVSACALNILNEKNAYRYIAYFMMKMDAEKHGKILKTRITVSTRTHTLVRKSWANEIRPTENPCRLWQRMQQRISTSRGRRQAHSPDSTCHCV